MAGAGLQVDNTPAAPAAPVTPSSVGSRVKTGLEDMGVGIAQLTGHLFGKEKISPQERAAYGVGPDEDLDFDKVVADREKAYKAGRAAAGSTGFDWARTFGEIANPGNYVLPGGGGSGVLARAGSAAAQGAGVASLNPVTEPGNFWGGKAWQAGTGAVSGTLVSGAISVLAKPFSLAAQSLKSLFGKAPQADKAAQGVIDQTLNTVGIKPADLPPEMVDGARDQIAKVIKSGGEVSPASLQAQAEAASLPIPIKLTPGQASGDALHYASEQELAKMNLKGGNPLQQLMSENNQKLIDNVGKLGADGAPTAADTGKAGLIGLAKKDALISAAKNAAYDAVKDSQGRSATLDADQFYVNATDRLKDQMASVNNSTVLQHMDDIAEGKLPLTVDTMMKLDKAWGRIQRTTADGNEAYGIGLLRNELNQTPVSSELGQETMAKYQAARSLARRQFELSDPKSQNFIPGYAAMLKGMGDASHNEFIAALDGGTANIDADKWFSQNVFQQTPAGVKKLIGFLKDDQTTTQALQHGTMGEIRDRVLKGNDAIGRSVFSNAAMQKVMDRAETLRQILPSDTVTALGRLYNTSSRISGVPYKSAVNWSNTAAASANMQAIREGAGTVATAAAEAVPGGKAVLAGADVVSDIGKRRAAMKAAQEATRPSYGTLGKPKNSAARAGVSLSALLSDHDKRKNDSADQ
jgi:hypothetical protein